MPGGAHSETLFGSISLKKNIKNIAASVYGRLTNIAKESRRPFAEVLQFYAMERFLYRFSQLPESKIFLLKGGVMFKVWDAASSRPTRDIDFLGSGAIDQARLSHMMTAACAIPCEEDGMVFDVKMIKTAKIKEDADYEGVRVTFMGFLGKSRAPIQIDIGFGDVVFPKPVPIDYPTLLDLPAPKLQAYTKESVIAEKVHAMVLLRILNSRMKDFYDLWFLSSHFDFDGGALSESMKRTFQRRKTAIEAEPEALTSRFASDTRKLQQWNAFSAGLKAQSELPTFPGVIAAIGAFVAPVLHHLHKNKVFNAKWNAKQLSWKQ